MNCGFDRELLSIYADGALAPSRVPDVENHIAGCEGCRGVLAEFRELGMALQSLPRDVAPRGLIGRIIAGTGELKPRTLWDDLSWTIGAVWKVAMDGGTIDGDREEALRRDSPAWVARWVLFI